MPSDAHNDESPDPIGDNQRHIVDPSGALSQRLQKTVCYRITGFVRVGTDDLTEALQLTRVVRATDFEQAVGVEHNDVQR